MNLLKVELAAIERLCPIIVRFGFLGFRRWTFNDVRQQISGVIECVIQVRILQLALALMLRSLNQLKFLYNVSLHNVSLKIQRTKNSYFSRTNEVWA